MAGNASGVILEAQQLLLSTCRMTFPGVSDGMLGAEEHSEQHHK
jgi:hypothetical protein